MAWACIQKNHTRSCKTGMTLVPTISAPFRNYFYRNFFSGQIPSRGSGRIGSVRVTRPRPVTFDNLLTRRDPTREISNTPPDPTRLDPRGFENFLGRSAGRVMTREERVCVYKMCNPHILARLPTVLSGTPFFFVGLSRC